MANLDMSDVLLDLDFMDTVVCVRTTQTVGTNGLSSVATTQTSFPAVVTSGGGDILERIDSGDRVRGNIMVISKFILHDGSGVGFGPDKVLWGGNTYTVSNVQSFSNYGAGFSEASCDIVSISG